MISLLVAKKEFIRSLKNKKKLVIVFLLPIISIMLAMLINSIMKPAINIGIYGNNEISKEFKAKLKVVEGINVYDANRDTINTDMILSKYMCVIEFNDDNNFNIYCLDNNMKDKFSYTIEEVINSNNISLIKDMLIGLEEGNLSIAERSNGFISVILIITATMSATIFINDRNDKVITRFSITPHKISKYLLGNYIYNLITTIIQILLSTIFIILFKLDIGIQISYFITVGIIIAVIASSIAMLITIISNSELQASLLSSSLSLIMALLGGALLPIEKMPDMIKELSNISIIKWIIEITSDMQKGFTNNNLLFMLSMILLGVIIAIVSIKIGEIRYKKVSL